MFVGYTPVPLGHGLKSHPLLDTVRFSFLQCFCFLKKCVCSFFFSFLKYMPLPAFVSGFNKRCFLRSRCSVEVVS